MRVLWNRYIVWRDDVYCRLYRKLALTHEGAMNACKARADAWEKALDMDTRYLMAARMKEKFDREVAQSRWEQMKACEAVKCPECGSEMELTEKEVSTGFSVIVRYWKCPKCGHEEKVKE